MKLLVEIYNKSIQLPLTPKLVMLMHIPLSMIHNDKRKFCGSDFKRCYRIESRLWIEKKIERLSENCAIIFIITASNISVLDLSSKNS